MSSVADDSDETINQFGKLLMDSDPLAKWTVLDALSERYERIAKLIPEIIKLLDDDSEVYIAISNHFSKPEKLRGRVARLLTKIGPRASDAIPKLKELTGREYTRMFESGLRRPSAASMRHRFMNLWIYWNE